MYRDPVLMEGEWREEEEDVEGEGEEEGPLTKQNQVRKTSHMTWGPQVTMDVRGAAIIGNAYTHMIVNADETLVSELKATLWIWAKIENPVKIRAKMKPERIMRPERGRRRRLRRGCGLSECL